MDTATLLLLLALLSGNDQMKASLRSLLAIYRENRELIAALLNNAPPPPHGAPCEAPPPPPPCDPPHGRPNEKCRPLGGIGTLDILEEYLKKL